MMHMIRIVFTGSESTGKSTLAVAVANHYGVEVVPEPMQPPSPPGGLWASNTRLAHCLPFTTANIEGRRRCSHLALSSQHAKTRVRPTGCATGVGPSRSEFRKIPVVEAEYDRHIDHIANQHPDYALPSVTKRLLAAQEFCEIS